jgi:hypothetical protein
MAYAPRPELANQIARALDPESLPENVTPIRPASATSFLERLEEEIPAKWLREVERIFAEGDMPLPAPGDSAIPGERAESRQHLAAVEAPQDRWTAGLPGASVSPVCSGGSIRSYLRPLRAHRASRFRLAWVAATW